MGAEVDPVEAGEFVLLLEFEISSRFCFSFSLITSTDTETEAALVSEIRPVIS